MANTLRLESLNYIESTTQQYPANHICGFSQYKNQSRNPQETNLRLENIICIYIIVCINPYIYIYFFLIYLHCSLLVPSDKKVGITLIHIFGTSPCITSTLASDYCSSKMRCLAPWSGDKCGCHFRRRPAIKGYQRFCSRGEDSRGIMSIATAMSFWNFRFEI